MNSQAIKLELIEWLTQLKDETTLEIIKSVKDSDISNIDWWNNLSDTERQGIERGLKDSENGNLVDHVEVKRRYGL
jgi:hypothetical protein